MWEREAQDLKILPTFCWYASSLTFCALAILLHYVPSCWFVYSSVNNFVCLVWDLKKKTVRNTLRHKEIVPSRCKQCIHTTPFHCWGNCGALYQRMPVKLPHGQCVSSCVRQCLSLTLISTSVEQVVEARNSLLIKFILLCAVLKPFITKDDLQEWNRRFQLLGKKRSSTSSYLEVEVNKIRFNGCMQTLQVAIEFYVLWGTRGKLLPTQEI